MSSNPRSAEPPPGKRQVSGRVVPRRLHWYHHVLAALIAAGVGAVSATWRVRIVDYDGVFNGPRGPMIFCLWHNRLAISMRAWKSWVEKRHPSSGLAALISASHDGGILSRALGYFGVKAVRGSTSRRGPQALLELTSLVERGFHIAITPDGPRGPRYKVQEGIVALAQVTGVAIIPVSTHVRWKIRLRSWDRFQVPLPFARCELRFGKPICVAREADAEERETVRAELERRMVQMTND